MAIQLYAGLQGSGKSYGVVENVLIPACNISRPVYCNIPLYLDQIYAEYPQMQGLITLFTNDQLTGDFLMEIPGGAVIIIDECWRFWPSGLTASKIEQKFKEFFAEHRHKTGENGLTQEICLITQSPSQIAKVVRDLVDQTVITRKNTAAGSDKTFNMDIYPGCAKGLDNPGQSITGGFGRYKPEIYRFYKSHTKSETGLPGMEKRADNRGRFWNNPYFRYVLPLIFASGVWGVYYTYTFFSGQKMQKKTQKQELQQSIQVHPQNQTKPKLLDNNQPVQSVQNKPEQPLKSMEWRITGVIYINKTSIIVYAENSTGQHRRLPVDDCDIMPSGVSCRFEGEEITPYTGQRTAQNILATAAQSPMKAISGAQ